MATAETVVEALYDHFLLRDLFAKIVPGGAVLAALLSDDFLVSTALVGMEDSAWPAIIVAGGLSWVLGYSIQEIGEIAGLIRHHPAEYDNPVHRYKRRIQFKRQAGASERKQEERYERRDRNPPGRDRPRYPIGVRSSARRSSLGHPGNLLRIVRTGAIEGEPFSRSQAIRVHRRRPHACGVVMASPKVVALDFDGVIVDSMPIQEALWSRALEAVTPAIRQQDRELVVANLWRGHARARIFEGTGLSQSQRDEVRHRKDALWREMRSNVPLVSDVAATLCRLSRRYELAIATTADREYVEDVLRRADIEGLFLALVTDEDVSRPKPDPEMLQVISAEAGVEPFELLMVGDTPADREMAATFGCPFVLIDVHGRRNLPTRITWRLASGWR